MNIKFSDFDHCTVAVQESDLVLRKYLCSLLGQRDIIFPFTLKYYRMTEQMGKNVNIGESWQQVHRRFL